MSVHPDVVWLLGADADGGSTRKVPGAAGDTFVRGPPYAGTGRSAGGYAWRQPEVHAGGRRCSGQPEAAPGDEAGPAETVPVVLLEAIGGEDASVVQLHGAPRPQEGAPRRRNPRPVSGCWPSWPTRARASQAALGHGPAARGMGAPPPADQGGQLCILSDGMRRGVDVTQSDLPVRWTLEASTAHPDATIALTWPDLSGLPPELRPVLIDPDSGKRCSIPLRGTLSVRGPEAVITIAGQHVRFVPLGRLDNAFVDRTGASPPPTPVRRSSRRAAGHGSPPRAGTRADG